MNPFVIVSTLKKEDREAVVEFLLKVGAPTYLEAVSGIREDERLCSIRVRKPPLEIDRVIRIGGVPTHRFWRDLENKEFPVYSISHLPFPGLTRGEFHHVDIPTFLNKFSIPKVLWDKQEDELVFDTLLRAEPTLFHLLSKKIPQNSLVYLGNSMPIREWDLAATYENRNFDVQASRGVNGIDGQLSTFLGLCRPNRENWAILGDLTTLYDLAAPWILPQLERMSINIVVVNNGGGKIFSRMYAHPEFQNNHALNFEPFAKMWGLEYERWEEIHPISSTKPRLIELIPDEAQTNQFWENYECSTLSTVS